MLLWPQETWLVIMISRLDKCSRKTEKKVGSTLGVRVYEHKPTKSQRGIY